MGKDRAGRDGTGLTSHTCDLAGVQGMRQDIKSWLDRQTDRHVTLVMRFQGWDGMGKIWARKDKNTQNMYGRGRGRLRRTHKFSSLQIKTFRLRRIFLS